MAYYNGPYAIGISLYLFPLYGNTLLMKVYMSKFNRDVFAAAFQASLDMLAQSEVVTKRELMALSRSVLEATHETGDIQFVNKLIAILTPVNKKVAIVFFTHFTGFTFDDALKMFTKKSKKRYDSAHKEYVEFMADPHQNIWTWADRHIEIQAKEFELSKVTKFIENALKKALDAKLSQVDVLKAVLKGGISADSIVAIIAELSEDKEAMLNKVSDALGFEAEVKE